MLETNAFICQGFLFLSLSRYLASTGSNLTKVIALRQLIDKTEMDLELPSKLHKALEREASDAGRSLHAHVIKQLESVTPPIEAMRREVITAGLPKLVAFLSRVPGVEVLSSDSTPDAFWWVKLNLDLDHSLAWQVVQELGFVLNYISLEEQLPTVFKPVSPPPYMNGGPKDFLSWVLEPTHNYIDPAWIAEALEGRLPRPVEDLAQWDSDDEST